MDTKGSGLFRRRPVVSLLLATMIVSLPFLIFPALDIGFSRLFFEPGKGFDGSQHPILIGIREVGVFALKLVGVLLLLSLLVPLLIAPVRWLFRPRAALFLLTTLALGPGLLVNVVLKDNWGRVRPRSIVEFGGDRPFSLPWQIVDHCDSNCSFASGEASSAMWFMALAMLVPLAWRLPAALAVFAFAAVMSLNRIVFGGHFLSDVLVSWTLTLIVIVFMYKIFYRNAAISDERVDEWFTKIRSFLHAPFRLLLGKRG